MTSEKQLILFNDSEHNFDYVYATLLKEVHPYAFQQAEQLVTIAHYTGKASIKEGDIMELIEIQEKLFKYGLKTEITSLT
jgi:ATP-dependent Clp protease adapter protein ClpS